VSGPGPASNPMLAADHGDYFANHARAHKLPWSLYHRPLEDDLAVHLRALRPGARVAVIGCGLLHELALAPAGVRVIVADVDERAVEAVLARGDARIERGVVVAPSDTIDQHLGAQDLIYAKEVVEHIVPPQPWIDGCVRALAPGGRLWLSTPNYGEPWLAALEATALELVARRDGFTRKGLHPSRYSAARLRRALGAAGLADVDVKTTWHRLALTGTGVKR
jgi:2-polyprenyl-3-methyl-5-hydroxy-6-metoxy-1,4-benzoquinol methylase